MVSIILLDKHESEQALVQNIVSDLNPVPQLSYFHKCSEIEAFLYSLSRIEHPNTCYILLADFFLCLDEPGRFLTRLHDEPPEVPVVIVAQSFTLGGFGDKIMEQLQRHGVNYFISKEELFDEYREKLLAIIKEIIASECQRGLAA